MLTDIDQSISFMSLPDLIMHRIVHYVLDATETSVTNTLSDDATEGVDMSGI